MPPMPTPSTTTIPSRSRQHLGYPEPALAAPAAAASRASIQHIGRRVAHAVADFEQRLLGRPPRHVTVTVNGRLIVVSLQQPLAAVERDVASDPAGGGRVRLFHHELFGESHPALREHVAAATGVDLSAGVLDIDLENGCLIKTYSTGTTIDFCLLGPAVPPPEMLLAWHARRSSQAATDDPVDRQRTPASTTEAEGNGALRDCLQSRRTGNHEEVTHVGTNTKESRKRDHRPSRGSGSDA